MDLLTLIASLVFTFGLISFGTLSYKWFLERGRRCDFPRMATHGVMAALATVWFSGLLLGIGFDMLYPEFGGRWDLGMWSMAFLWPPLIMQMIHGEAAEKIDVSAWWRWSATLTWVPALAVGAVPLLYMAGIVPRIWLKGAVVVFVGLFSLAAVYSFLLERKSRADQETSEERTNRFWNGLLWALVMVVMGSALVGRPGPLSVVFGLIGPAFPLLFVFVNTYYLQRLTFFDIFVKRWSFSLLALLLLSAFFKVNEVIWVTPGFEGARVWVSALLFLPLALSLPWLYNRLNAWLDRVWLGRRFSAEEAVKHFLADLGGATGEAELVRCAQDSLQEIFQTPVEVIANPPTRDSGEPATLEPVKTVEVPIRLGTKVAGCIRIGRRANRMPLFSRDVALLMSLAEVFAYNLENVRLQSRKQEQEKQARELMIHASRSELKALRAQINPHFLFNALNAIAGLIPRRPGRAEETVEQLAEVFRYTLKGSDKEWTRLEDEMEFVRAYLDVEKARFGKRLAARIELEPGLADVRIPTMLVQTLVENAVKHGIMRIRARGEIGVRAFRRAGRIRIEVSDNGPGWGHEMKPGEIPASTKGSGFGLRSVKERLAGHFEERAELDLTRDDSRGLTIVAIEFPASLPAFERKTGTD